MKTIKFLGYCLFWGGLVLISLSLGHLLGYIIITYNISPWVCLSCVGIFLGVGLMGLGCCIIDRSKS